VLLDQVRQHAEAGRQLQSPHHLLEQLLETHDGVDVVRGGIEADDDIAAPVREPVEDREQDLALVVARAVRLNARPEVRGAADAARHLRQLVARHHLDDGRNRLAPERGAVTGGPRLAAGVEQGVADAPHRPAVQIGVVCPLARSRQRVADAVVDEGRPMNLAKGDGREVPPRIAAYPLVVAAAHGAVALLEGAGERQRPAQGIRVHLERMVARVRKKGRSKGPALVCRRAA